MTLDIEDKNYIKTELQTGLQGLRSEFVEQFDRHTKHFDERFEHLIRLSDQRFEHFFGILREDFNHKLSILIEIAKDKPPRGEVREIVREEAGYVVHDEIKKFAPAY